MITEKMMAEYLEGTGHSLFGASSLGQRELCPASALEEYKAFKEFGVEESSRWARAGTLLHAHMEEALQVMVDRGEEEGLKYFQVIENEEEKGWCEDCYTYAISLIKKHENPRVSIEVSGNLSHYDIKGVEGTADLVIASENRLDVVDWKFGRGVPVFAEDNLQGACYAAMALRGRNPEKVAIHIAQAPLDSFTGWDVTPLGIRKIITLRVFDIVSSARTKVDTYNPSMQACRFCRVKMSCIARQKYMVESQKAVVAAAANPQKVPEDKYLKLLDMADAIQQAIKDVRKYAEQVIVNGGKFGDYKMVDGRGSRKPISKKEFEKFLLTELGDKAYQPRKFVSVAQAEKVKPSLKKDKYFKELWEKVPGKPVLVKGTDKRKALSYGATSAFQKYIGE